MAPALVRVLKQNIFRIKFTTGGSVDSFLQSLPEEEKVFKIQKI